MFNALNPNIDANYLIRVIWRMVYAQKLWSLTG